MTRDTHNKPVSKGTHPAERVRGCERTAGVAGVSFYTVWLTPSLLGRKGGAKAQGGSRKGDPQRSRGQRRGPTAAGRWSPGRPGR